MSDDELPNGTNNNEGIEQKTPKSEETEEKVETPVSALEQIKATSSESSESPNKSPTKAPTPTPPTPTPPQPPAPEVSKSSSFSIANLTNKKEKKPNLAEQLRNSFSNTNPKSTKPTTEMTKQLETKSNITQMIKDQKPKSEDPEGLLYFKTVPYCFVDKSKKNQNENSNNSDSPVKAPFRKPEQSQLPGAPPTPPLGQQRPTAPPRPIHRPRKFTYHQSNSWNFI